ncbi:cytochrome c [Pistricoccus aurantiacus]|uniref:Cytochrome c n=1 Tax=Pistricoccus aurantiacus TaxID=1883414 RepID=A0A5B8SWQ9_9GAMM|nr:cytochrome c [Pistricoccus aurantiacus]QEA39995.1 cytochrome c [Pistricoccus aurantiacus]
MKTMISLAVASTLLMSGAALAQDGTKVEDAIKYRQSALTTLAWNFGPLGAMAKGDMDYDAEEAAMRAKRVQELAVMPWEGFIEGSLRNDGHGIETAALAKTGDNWDDFEKKQQDFEEEATKLAEVVSNDDDFAALRKQVAATSKTCKNCHDEYRAEN